MNSMHSAGRSRYRDALAQLRAAQKPARGTAAYSRYVNRPAGRLVAAAGHAVGLTPDQATVISGALSAGALALVAMAEPLPVVGVAIAGLLAGAYVMDSVDGQLARLRGGGTRRGEFLDHMVDCFKITLLHVAVLVSWYRFPRLEGDGWLAVPIFFLVVAVATFFGLLLMPTLRPSMPPTPDREEHPLRKWALLPIDYGVVCLSFVTFGLGWVFGVVYLALAVAAGLALAAALVMWWRALTTIDAAQLPQ